MRLPDDLRPGTLIRHEDRPHEEHIFLAFDGPHIITYSRDWGFACSFDQDDFEVAESDSLLDHLIETLRSAS
jgi:hypothetical protein